MADPLDDPRVQKLLLLLWNAPDQNTGLVVRDLPAELLDSAVITVLFGDGLIESIRRNHVWVGGKFRVEPGWDISSLHGILVSDYLRAVCCGDTPEAILERVRLTSTGRTAAAKLSLAPGAAAAPQPSGQPVESSTGDNEVTGFLGGEDLAKALGVHPTRRDAFLRQLARERTNLPDTDWHEVRARRPNCPQFLYRVDSHDMRVLAVKYQVS